MADWKMQHAVEFTNIEILTLEAWEEAILANLEGTAGRILSTGLLYEHYTSLLDDDPAKRTPQELDDQKVLKAQLQAALDELNKELGGTYHA